jgi:DNA polymerase III delta prime subunit
MTQLTEKFRPKTETDVVGNKEAITRLKDAMTRGVPVFVHGSAGIGKTSSVQALANDLGLRVREWNASDERRKEELSQVLRMVTSNSLEPVLFLMDEVDGVEDFKTLEAIVKGTKHPLVLIANEKDKVPQSIQRMCEEIRFYRPKVSEVFLRVQYISQATGMSADYSRISQDVRSSINNAFFGGEHYDVESRFDVIEKYFKKGEIRQLETIDELWLMDNGLNFLNGKKLYVFHQMLALCAQIGNFEPLRACEGGTGEVKVPRYFRRQSVLKKGAKKTEEE